MNIPSKLNHPSELDIPPLAKLAVKQLQETLALETFAKKGSMVAVLVVEGQHNQRFFLAACRNFDNDNGFVPLLTEGELLINNRGDKKTIDCFVDKRHLKADIKDFLAVALFQQAYKFQLSPLAFAQFWWGASPDDEVRHHAHFYPAYRGRCAKVLPFMLEGLDVVTPTIPGLNFSDKNQPEIVYEDEYLLLVNKPSGLLSVPGKEVNDSVQTRMQMLYPEATGPLLLHRLDQATSGLILVAKHKDIHKALQKQLMARQIEKEYVALLQTSEFYKQHSGTIKLPLRVDIFDRPRQMVCYSHGKPAITRWEMLSFSSGFVRVKFFPITGRTHQLRVHAAHKNGLNAPIVGDSLYGKADTRLMLHASLLSFTHPISGKHISVSCEPEF